MEPKKVWKKKRQILFYSCCNWWNLLLAFLGFLLVRRLFQLCLDAFHYYKAGHSATIEPGVDALGTMFRIIVLLIYELTINGADSI
ncbi:hypothetical protein Trydic_g704 [Trypoxylus dichotomus]